MALFRIPPPEDPADRRLVIGYARVSTRAAGQDTSIEGQVAEFERMGCDRVVAERQSASDGSVRQGFTELRLLVAQRQVRLVLVVDLSRLGRDGSDLEFLEECSLVRTTVMDLTGKTWESQSLDGLLTAGITSLMNRVQARMIGLKAADGLRRRRDAGFVARGKFPFGYALIEGRARPHPTNWDRARELFESLLAADMNVIGCLRQLPADFPWQPTPRGLVQWFQNPMLRGGLGYGRSGQGWERVEWGRAPMLITQEEYETAMALFQSRPKHRTRIGEPTTRLFTGLLRCSSCGKNLCYHKPQRETYANRYQCRFPSCSVYGRTVREDVVKQAVAAELAKKAKALADVALLDDTVEDSPEVIKLREQIRQLEVLHRQGVQGLRPTILKMRDEVAGLQRLALSPRWATPDYLRIFSTEEAFLGASDSDFRVVCVHMLERIECELQSKKLRVHFRR